VTFAAPSEHRGNVYSVTIEHDDETALVEELRRWQARMGWPSAPSATIAEGGGRARRAAAIIAGALYGSDVSAGAKIPH